MRVVSGRAPVVKLCDIYSDNAFYDVIGRQPALAPKLSNCSINGTTEGHDFICSYVKHVLQF